MGKPTELRVKILLSIVVILLGIYWYALEAPIAGTGISNFGALVLAIKAVLGAAIILIGIAATWIYSDRLNAAIEEEQSVEKGFEETLERVKENEGPLFDYESIVSGTVDEVKQEIKKVDAIDLEKALEAEKEGKDRKTLKEWIRSRMK